MRLNKVKQLMDEMQLDAIVLGNPENIRYVSGYYNPIQRVRPNNLNSYLIITRERQPLLIVHGASIGLTTKISSSIEVVVHNSFPIQGICQPLSKRDEDLLSTIKTRCYPSETEALRSCLGKGMAKIQRIGIDCSGINWLSSQTLGEAIGNASPVVNIYQKMEKIRLIKSSEEIDCLRQAAKIVEQALDTVLKEIQPGISERELTDRYESAVIRLGGQPLFSIIGFADNGAYPNWLPGDRLLEKGNVIRFDIGCQYEGYCADIARTAVVGRVPESYRLFYAAILKGYYAALEVVKPGASTSTVFATAVDTIRKSGIPGYERIHCGHGIGLNLYEGLNIARDDQEKLQPNMVFCLETPYYHFGLGGFQIENMILVNETGYEVLNSLNNRLVVVQE